MTTPKSQEPVITSVTELPTDKARWVTLQQINYTDQTGKARTWEVAARKTRAATAGVDAVAIGNILLPASGGPPSTIIVIQYRPPLDAYTVEWPAGLIDEGETAEQAAVREFKEETGYQVTRVVDVSPVQAADPGMSNANMKMVMVEVDLPEGVQEGVLPDQRLEDGEHIERVVVRLDEFYDKLVEYSKRERFVVAAKLFHFAAGMQFVRKRGEELKLL
ncbi:ADP-sugar pyrophosphatase [Cladorrhinum sp. PSN332]|nr:ADP-sugar pyrophosphatase [Cladorrhinum sp. PSN332]